MIPSDQAVAGLVRAERELGLMGEGGHGDSQIDSEV
jgi:hypothetical protein